MQEKSWWTLGLLAISWEGIGAYLMHAIYMYNNCICMEWNENIYIVNFCCAYWYIYIYIYIFPFLKSFSTNNLIFNFKIKSDLCNFYPRIKIILKLFATKEISINLFHHNNISGLKEWVKSRFFHWRKLTWQQKSTNEIVFNSSTRC